MLRALRSRCQHVIVASAIGGAPRAVRNSAAMPYDLRHLIRAVRLISGRDTSRPSALAAGSAVTVEVTRVPSAAMVTSRDSPAGPLSSVSVAVTMLQWAGGVKLHL